MCAESVIEPTRYTQDGPVLLLGLVLLAWGCGAEPQTRAAGIVCDVTADCFFPEVCVDGFCADETVPGQDAGQAAMDSGQAREDAGSPPVSDAGSPPVRDAGSPPVQDAGSPPVRDAGPPPKPDAGGCVGSCDDGNPCTRNDRCVDGRCQGTRYTCDDGNVCTDNSCNGDGTCSFTSNTDRCDDGNACTSGDQCGGGRCQGRAYSCNDSNVCTNDMCDGSGGCTRQNNQIACEDGNAWTEGDMCGGGVCSGTACGARGESCCPSRVCRGTLSCKSGTCLRCTTSDPQAARSVSLPCGLRRVQGVGNTLRVLGQSATGHEQTCQGFGELGTILVRGVTFGGTVNLSCGRITRIRGRGDRIEIYGQEPQGPDQDCRGSVVVGSISVTGARVTGDVQFTCGLSTLSGVNRRLRFSGRLPAGNGDCSGNGTIGDLTFAPVETCS